MEQNFRKIWKWFLCMDAQNMTVPHTSSRSTFEFPVPVCTVSLYHINDNRAVQIYSKYHINDNRAVQIMNSNLDKLNLK